MHIFQLLRIVLTEPHGRRRVRQVPLEYVIDGAACRSRHRYRRTTRGQPDRRGSVGRGIPVCVRVPSRVGGSEP